MRCAPAIAVAILLSGCSTMIPPGKRPPDGWTDTTEPDIEGDWPFDTQHDGVVCTPDQSFCFENDQYRCDSDGTGYSMIQECADPGMTCDPELGCQAASECEEATLGESHVGCTFWAVPLPVDASLDPMTYSFGVMVTNQATSETASVTITRYGHESTHHAVGPSESHVITLDILESFHALDPAPWSSRHMGGVSYLIESDRPVAVQQLDPVDPVTYASNAMSAGASRLLPVHALDGRYIVVGRPPTSARRTDLGGEFVKKASYVAVVAVEDGVTDVDITPSCTTAGGGEISEIAAGTTHPVMMQRGEVLLLACQTPPDCTSGRPGFETVDGPYGPNDFCLESGHDITGTAISGSRKLAVFSGAVELAVPHDVWTTDHVEEQLPPLTALGTNHVTMPLWRSSSDGVDALLRVLATQDGTHFDVSGVGGFDLDQGYYQDVVISGPSLVTSSAPVLVAQFMVGQHYVDPALPMGDPGMTILVPVEQWLTSYTFGINGAFATVPDVKESHVAITRSWGTAVTLDGSDPAGGTAMWQDLDGYQLITRQVGDGWHVVEADGPVGVTIFGLGAGAGYAMPAGAGLAQIFTPG